jgi:hypothetical protein
MTHRFGYDFARDYGIAHERLPDGHNPAHREAMDLHNNEVGRRIATAHLGASAEELLELADQALQRGELLVIDADGHIQWSDRVARDAIGDPTDAPVTGHTPDDRQNLP